MENTSEAVREARLRRAAKRQEMILQKSRRRDPYAVDYGGYWLVDFNNCVIYPSNANGMTATLDEIEAFLMALNDENIRRVNSDVEQTAAHHDKLLKRLSEIWQRVGPRGGSIGSNAEYLQLRTEADKVARDLIKLAAKRKALLEERRKNLGLISTE